MLQKELRNLLHVKAVQSGQHFNIRMYFFNWQACARHISPFYLLGATRDNRKRDQLYTLSGQALGSADQLTNQLLETNKYCLTLTECSAKLRPCFCCQTIVETKLKSWGICSWSTVNVQLLWGFPISNQEYISIFT